ncbi:hypothetical protein Tco_1400121 [Tanacetum coccineum]
MHIPEASSAIAIDLSMGLLLRTHEYTTICGGCTRQHETSWVEEETQRWRIERKIRKRSEMEESKKKEMDVVWTGSSLSAAAGHNLDDLTPSHIRSNLDALHRRICDLLPLAPATDTDDAPTQKETSPSEPQGSPPHDS